MDTETALALIAVTGTILGTFAGAFVNHFLEKSRHQHEFIMSAKKETYAQLIGYARNLILKDFNSDEEKIMHRVLSEALLICDNNLTEPIRVFANDLDNYLQIKNQIGNKEILTKLKSLAKILKDDLSK